MSWSVILCFIFGVLFLVFMILYLSDNSNSEMKLTKKEQEEFVPPPNPSVTHSLMGNHKFKYVDNIDELRRIASENFIISKYKYSWEFLNKKPTITIVTRTYNRPDFLGKCLYFMKNMSNKDFEFIVLEDQHGMGMQIAETALHSFLEFYEGEYICHCDDDDFIGNVYFVENMVRIIHDNHPDIIFHKSWKEEENIILPKRWRKFPVEGEIDTVNWLLKKSIYTLDENIKAISQNHAGDYLFLYNCLMDCNKKKIMWYDNLQVTISDKNHFTANTEYVTMKWMGGLGNQLFELACAYAYGKANGKLLVADHSIKRIDDGFRSTYWDSILSWVTNIYGLNTQHWNVMKENKFNYEKLPKKYGHVVIEGYRQSESYFEPIKEEFVQQILRVLPPSKKFNTSKIPISLHIRRTDYVNNSVHTLPTIYNYYQPALKKLLDITKLEVESVCLIVFSDDISWCKENFVDKFLCEVMYIEGNNELVDLSLMKSCKHHIIANSSFSWWGSYLGGGWNRSSTIIAPKQWFGSEINDWSYIYNSSHHFI